MPSPHARPSFPHVVILGGGFAGLEAARRLKRAPLRITLIDRRNHHLFQPLLYQVATAALSPAEIASPIRTILKHQRNAEVMLAEATHIDTASRQIVLEGDTRIRYDYLIVATGATHAYFGHDDWEDVAPGLKTLEDAIEIRRRFLSAFEEADRERDADAREKLLRFVVVGAGPTGVELAGTMAEMTRHALGREYRHVDPSQAHVVLLEGGPRVLPAYSEALSAAAERQLTALGVDVRTDSLVTEMRPGTVCIGDAKNCLEAANVFWAAGIKASPLANCLGVELDRAGRVRVEATLTVPGVPNVYVLGDLASVKDASGHPVPGIAPAALQMGRYAANRILRQVRQDRAPGPFRYRDKGSMATIGKAAAIARMGKLEFTGWPAWMAWLAVHIYFLIGFRNRLIVLIQWAWAYVANRSGTRLITNYSPRPESSGEAD